MNNLKQFNSLLIKKQNLLGCIFSTLLLQVIITTLVFLYFYQQKILTQSYSFLSIFLLLLFDIFLIYVMTTFNISFSLRFLIFIIFSIIQGIFLGISLKYVDKSILISSLLSTIFLFLSLLIIGFGIVYLKINLSWFGGFLFFALLSLIFFQIISIFIPPSNLSIKLMTTFALLIFSGFILYDTNNILLKFNNSNKGVDCIRGALEYYLDIINIFINLTRGES